jgi:hypothetical protein
VSRCCTTAKELLVKQMENWKGFVFYKQINIIFWSESGMRNADNIWCMQPKNCVNLMLMKTRYQLKLQSKEPHCLWKPHASISQANAKNCVYVIHLEQQTDKIDETKWIKNSTKAYSTFVVEGWWNSE